MALMSSLPLSKIIKHQNIITTDFVGTLDDIRTGPKTEYALFIPASDTPMVQLKVCRHTKLHNVVPRGDTLYISDVNQPLVGLSFHTMRYPLVWTSSSNKPCSNGNLLLCSTYACDGTR